MSGVYSNTEIRKAIKAGQIVCHPLVEKNIKGSSLDVTLGRWYYRTEYETDSAFYNPFSKKDVTAYFAGPFEAVEHAQWAKQAKIRLLENVPAQQSIIVLKPNERILAHTHEFFGIKPPGTSQMLARSSWGRNGLAVCFDSGWGDPGYINRWTMEIYNLNKHHGIVLPVGERLAQIIFYHTGPVEGDYTQISGKYQASTRLSQLIENWKPADMLPKSYMDQRQQPLEIDADEV